MGINNPMMRIVAVEKAVNKRMHGTHFFSSTTGIHPGNHKNKIQNESLVGTKLRQMLYATTAAIHITLLAIALRQVTMVHDPFR